MEEKQDGDPPAVTPVRSRVTSSCGDAAVRSSSAAAAAAQRGRVLVLLSAVCFGTTGTAQAVGAPDVSPVAVGAARIVVGGLLLALVALAVRRRGSRVVAAPRMFPPAATRRRVAADAHNLTGRGPAGGRGRGAQLAVVGIGALGVAAYQPTFFAGVERSGVAVGTVVALGSAPVLTGLLQWAVLRRRPGPWWVLATMLATAGVAVLAVAGGGDARLDPVGVACSVGAGGSYAVYTLASKALLDGGWSTTDVMGSQFGAAAVLMVPVLLLAGTGWLATPSGAATALFLGVVPTTVAYLLFARGLALVTAAETATLTLAEPVTAGLLGVVVLGERLGAASGVGVLLLLAGMAVLVLSGRPRAPATARTSERMGS